jgi:hypothetical protein
MRKGKIKRILSVILMCCILFLFACHPDLESAKELEQHMQDDHKSASEVWTRNKAITVAVIVGVVSFIVGRRTLTRKNARLKVKNIKNRKLKALKLTDAQKQFFLANGCCCRQLPILLKNLNGELSRALRTLRQLRQMDNYVIMESRLRQVIGRLIATLRYVAVQTGWYELSQALGKIGNRDVTIPNPLDSK